MNKIKEYTEKVFEDIKHIDEFGNEYWYARELQNILGYHQWRSISYLIERAKVACKESKCNVGDHFALHRKMVIYIIFAFFTGNFCNPPKSAACSFAGFQNQAFSVRPKLARLQNQSLQILPGFQNRVFQKLLKTAACKIGRV